MADSTLKDLSNPFNLRRLQWHDKEGRLNSLAVGVLDVEQTLARLGEEGIKKVQVDRLAWLKVYDVNT